MALYEQFSALDLDTSVLGFEKRSAVSDYDCTPAGAHVIGWAGVDGIHYCFVPGCGDMVFAVSPMNPEGETVHPLARSFADFIRLILACGSADALEQAYGWSREQFEAYLKEYPPTAKQQAVFNTIRDQLGLCPMDDPFSYLQQVQADFSSSGSGPSAFDQASPEQSEWQVFFSGSNHSRHRERAGREIAVWQWFDWEGQRCCIPSVYLCGKGLVIDIFAQVAPEKIKSFMEKWHLTADSDYDDFSRAQQMQMEAEHPLGFDITAQVQWGRQALHWEHASGNAWVPFFDEQCSESARQALEHYGLDPASAWVFRRSSLPWATRRRPALQPFRITLSQEPTAIPGPQLGVLSAGQRIVLTHPIRGSQHTLTVQSVCPESLSASLHNQNVQDYPTHFTLLQYTLEPDLPDSCFSISDSEPGDPPRARPDAGALSGAAAIGIIGGADGPTAFFVGSSAEAPAHAACSALRFEPANQVVWQTVFREKLRPDITVDILPNGKES